MKWWKTFSAVLAAGLTVFGVYQADIAADRKAANWDDTASVVVRGLKACETGWQMGTAMSRGPVESDLSLRGSIVSASAWLKSAPSRAKRQTELATEIDRAKALVYSAQLAKN